jgi:chromosome segregation ATPase
MDPSTFIDQASSKEKSIGNNRFQEEIHNLNVKLNNTVNQLKEHQNEIEKKNLEILDLKSINQKLKDEFSIQQKTHENIVSRLNHSIEGLNKSNKTLQSQVDNNVSQMNNVNSEKTNLENKIKTLEQNLNAKSTEIETIKKNHQEFIKNNDSKSQTIEQLNQKLTELQSNLDKEKELHSQIEKENMVLKDELIVYQNKNEELMTLTNRNVNIKIVDYVPRSKIQSSRKKH